MSEAPEETMEPVEGAEGEAADEPFYVELLDEKSGQSLAAEVQLVIEYGDRFYGVVTPVDAIVKVLRFDTADEESELEEMEPSDFAAVADEINQEMASLGCEIEVHADEFVLTGEPPEEIFDDPDTLEVETEYGDIELLVLLEHAPQTGKKGKKKGKKKGRKSRRRGEPSYGYLVTMPAIPPFWPAELSETGQARLPQPDEVDEALAEQFRKAVEMLTADYEDGYEGDEE